MTETTQELLARLTGFTPGPWKIDAGKGDWLGGFYADTYKVCTFGSDTTYYPTAGEAPNFWNSALIAAAPDLHRIATEQADEIDRLREALKIIAGGNSLTFTRNPQQMSGIEARDIARVALKEKT